jgi:hypothetical protein
MWNILENFDIVSDISALSQFVQAGISAESWSINRAISSV